MPYTWGLLGSLPRLHITTERLEQIPGQPPSLLHPPKGCAFNPRCAYAFDRCREELPELRSGAVGQGHRFRCHLADEDRARIWEAKKAAYETQGSAA
jgi:peptide/nickel transport system ATP-binding protein